MLDNPQGLRYNNPHEIEKAHSEDDQPAGASTAFSDRGRLCCMVGRGSVAGNTSVPALRWVRERIEAREQEVHLLAQGLPQAVYGQDRNGHA